MRVIYMGTPDFAVDTLEEIIRAGHEVVLVVTQPDKPKGRSGQLQFSDVKKCAVEHGIEVFQPNRIRLEENVEVLRSYNADIMVVAAFGQILTKEILDMPKYGCINVHASLLPKYRGASPIQWAVLNGEKETGVTIMRMDEGIDTGDMIAVRTLELDPKETGESLFGRLAKLGARLCVETMDAIENGTATYTPQDHTEATHTRMIQKEMGDIVWSKPAVEIERLIRGLNSWPSAYTRLGGKSFKIWSADVIAEDAATERPGTICHVTPDCLYVQTGDGILSLTEVQLEGKKRMDIASFLRGNQIQPGTVFNR